ncbi:LacI family gluconate utilization system Gnt-I transcriptional repressor [Pseudomonas sp. BIGb0408]|uniref:LacI family gluconate utilization system Gnt-I transcriptional repressor n=1 Tax=Phytopseudomonas flavescens TaxID=29435 RepID=A0A7Z0BLX6_9GAMM|nr:MULTISPECIES: LacI family DNA-binding transcriptional regulator [Pseudomonas]MCW2293557.1 LacI family gluconate utilization system Gnt-I transcriptional repressor [Pseudomonas sp. BIGb0408]NYH71872.1 LacI family gluconate utilization system Gnt-I transcriptional repressor [Pseudomonas flavescens]
MQRDDDRATGRRSSSAPSKPPTLADVAKVAGVSPITVSRTLNQPEIVRPELREKVFRAVHKTGYVPAMLTGVAEQRSRLISLLVPTVANSIFSDTVQALIDTLTEAGHETLIGLTNYSAEREEQLLDAILRRRPDGIVLTGTLHTKASRTRLSRSGIPIVESWDLAPRPLDMLVGFSHEAVGVATARYLTGKGYRRFAVVTLDDPRGHRRCESLIGELASQGIAEVPRVVLPPPATVNLGREGLQRLLAGGERPDVVVCSSDTLAHGILEEATELGIRVPQDLAVMGFGDLSSAAHLHPALSTVCINGADIGVQAARALVQRLDHPHEEPVKVRIDTGFSIVERQSA